MAKGVQRWSKTAGNNATADSTVNWAEGMAPSAVNDSARAEMASNAMWRDDISGTITTGGSSTAYTIATNQSFTADAAGMSGAMLCFIPHATSGLNPTLAVDGLTARAINQSTGVAVPTGALVLGTPYVVTYIHASTEFILQGALGAATFNDPVQLLSTDAGATVGPVFDIYRNSASPAANDLIGSVDFNGKDSAANKQPYGRILGKVLDPTSTTESGALFFQQTIAGVLTNVLQSSATAWLTALIVSLTNVTNALSLSGGTTAQRNPSPTAGDTRYNTSLNVLEYWNGTLWVTPLAMTRQLLTSGSAATYTTPAGCRKIIVKMIGGGGGGGATATNNGSTGGTTIFNSINANGGGGGVNGGTVGRSGGAGGTGGTGSASLRLPGSAGGNGASDGASGGGTGAPGLFGMGAGVGGPSGGTTPGAAAANTGAGGGGASAAGAGAGGGGSGEYVEIEIANPAATYTYTVGAVGAGGLAGTTAGANGGTGMIIVEEYY